MSRPIFSQEYQREAENSRQPTGTTSQISGASWPRDLNDNSLRGPQGLEQDYFPWLPVSRQNQGPIQPPNDIPRPGGSADITINSSGYGYNGNRSGVLIPRQMASGPAGEGRGYSYIIADNDPYEHIDLLGTGGYGYVDSVRRKDEPSAVFARKTICITSGRNREMQMKSVEREYEILNRLKHDHVVRVVDIYSFRNKLSIIMLEIADTDMEKYLDELDTLDTGPERYEMLKPLLMWQGCLIQAIDYLHEMKIKHRDLKPANILVKDGNVLITDFGIAKDLVDEETTQSLMSGGTPGTPMYMPPEVRLGGRRGRAVDIFSLGCIFLEIDTCLIAGPGSRERFAEHRELKGSRAFSRCPTQILQWFWYLWGCYAEYNLYYSRIPCYMKDCVFVLGKMLPGELAFMMLDPNPKMRISSRHLARKIHSNSTSWKEIKMKGCVKCRVDSMCDNDNIPLHSGFKEDDELMFPRPPEVALTSLLDLDWEGAKKLWLCSHMWW